MLNLLIYLLIILVSKEYLIVDFIIFNKSYSIPLIY